MQFNVHVRMYMCVCYVRVFVCLCVSVYAPVCTHGCIRMCAEYYWHELCNSMISHVYTVYIMVIVYRLGEYQISV